MHVNDCARCQALVNELAEAADALPLLAPEIEPPFGFEQRVLSSGRARRRRSVRRLIVGGRGRRRGRGHPRASRSSGSSSRGATPRASSASGTTGAREADRGEDGQRERSPRRVGLRHEQAFCRHRAQLRVEGGPLQIAVRPPAGSAVTIGTMAIDERSRVLDGHESASRSGRAARSSSSTPTARRPATEQSLKARRLRADKAFLVEFEGSRNANVPGVGPCRACYGRPRARWRRERAPPRPRRAIRSSARRSTGLSSDIGDDPTKGGNTAKLASAAAEGGQVGAAEGQERTLDDGRLLRCGHRRRRQP